jgi:hypothetical protein
MAELPASKSNPIAQELVESKAQPVKSEDHSKDAGDTGDAEKTKAPSLTDYLAFYETFRNYVRHEDNLINNRLSWILTIHGFLYATYGFTLQKELEVIRGPLAADFHNSPLCHSLSQAEIFLLCIALVGACISILGWRSIRAAHKSASSVDFVFRSNAIHTMTTIRNGNDDTDLQVFLDAYNFPAILGGGNKRIPGSGISAAFVIPWILFVSWLISIFILLFVWYDNANVFCSPFISIGDLKLIQHFHFS